MSSARASSAARCPASPRPRLISVTRRAARASSARTAAGSLSVSCQWRYRARPVCLTRHTPSAITIRLAGTGTMPAEASDSGSHDRSAAECGRKPPRPSSKTSSESSPCTSTPPPQSSICCRRLPLRASSTRPRCVMPRLSVSSEPSRPDAPAKRRAIRHQVSGVWTRRELSPAARSPQQLGWQSRSTCTCRRGAAICASERIASTALSKGASRPLNSAGRRSSTFRVSRSPAAISTPSASSQGALSSTAAAPRARASNAVASMTSTDATPPAQELAPGEMDRLTGAAAFGQPRRLHALQPLQRRQ